ncbi:sensory transduction protein kinase [Clostridium botulinum C str. Eklund]|nr:sensory transduction protein kinase [Clostridium botulinum C str. Eklund]NEZ48591.1 HAMP domain-containing histidine kinase [Clostridium botulinum]
MYLIVLVLLLIGLLARNFILKKEIRIITNQIKSFRMRNTDKEITINTGDKDIENLAVEFNEHLKLYKKNKQENIKFKKNINQEIANISHDLRTPLTGVIGYINLFKNKKISENEAIDIIESKSLKLKILIDSFFELLSVESDDYEVKFERINLSKIVSNELIEYFNEFEKRKIKLNINIDDMPIFILGEKYCVERIIRNLISNILKYGEKVILLVSNFCNNINEKDVPYIFDRFYMADKVRKEDGVGLGLPIVKSLMGKMNETVEAKFYEDKLSIICTWNKVN